MNRENSAPIAPQLHWKHWKIFLVQLEISQHPQHSQQLYLSWRAPILPNGVIIAYEVSYRPADNSGNELSLNTTDVESNFTAGNDLEGGSDYIFSVRAYTRVGPGTTSSLRASTLLQLGTAIDIVVTVGIVASFVTALFLIYIAVIMLYIYKRSRSRTKKQDKSHQSATASNLLSLPYTETPDTNASRDITNALKVTQISEEDEDFEDISFDSYDAEAVKEISPTHETVFDSKMTNLVCPVPADEFGDYVARCHSKDFKAQFVSLQQYDEEVPKTLRKFKLNRLSNFTVCEDNRVILKPIRGHSDYEEDFINASYIDGYNKEQQYIATQGPLPNTTVDFWRMVWQERSQSIVMVTNLVEGNRIKCHKYWPETGTLSFGPFNVTITGQQILADYTTREFSVQFTESPGGILTVTQFHFTDWPEYRVPYSATSLLVFLKKVKKLHELSKGPMIVHCSSGVGRTGTLITIDCVLEQLKEEEKVVDIAGVIIHLRTQRMKLVESLEQYIFVHDAILEDLLCGDTQIDARIFHKSMRKIINSPQTYVTEFEKQFKVLEKVSPKPAEVSRKEALRNGNKNRNLRYLPSDRWRVALRGGSNDYIHAVFASGYKQKRAFIIAQSPMESTARDFWKMVHDRKCGVIVMLCDLVEDGQEMCYQYWPQTGMVKFGEYTVDLTEEQTVIGYTIRKLSLSNTESGSAHQIVQLHITNWSPDGRCHNLSTVTSVISQMTNIQITTGNPSHCSPLQ
ncbi:Receptor-type tyrosine-protein phosphatase alpha [Geodia barretti]|uniref:Receptor-type tyrosine-protein phosphatase alpha n=1 Tax=Geodia barretti TaxID=519541 RepID=A0AA35WYW2_GEOBA|nr:Receptor-type tyrosine-protein phosphatase alpha [Geodia barretti]